MSTRLSSQPKDERWRRREIAHQYYVEILHVLAKLYEVIKLSELESTLESQLKANVRRMCELIDRFVRTQMATS